MKAEEARRIADENREPRYRSLLMVVINLIKSEAERGNTDTCIEHPKDLAVRLTTELEFLGYSVDYGRSTMRISWVKNEK
jgi:hypothetical protein